MRHCERIPLDGDRGQAAHQELANEDGEHQDREHHHTGPIFARELADRIVDVTVRDDYRRFSYDRVAAGPPFHRSFGGNRG